jgi:hypothetical protein
MVDKRRLFRIGAVALAAVVLVAAVWVLGMAGRLGLPAPTGQ